MGERDFPVQVDDHAGVIEGRPEADLGDLGNDGARRRCRSGRSHWHRPGIGRRGRGARRGRRCTGPGGIQSLQLVLYHARITGAGKFFQVFRQNLAGLVRIVQVVGVDLAFEPECVVAQRRGGILPHQPIGQRQRPVRVRAGPGQPETVPAQPRRGVQSVVAAGVGRIQPRHGVVQLDGLQVVLDAWRRGVTARQPGLQFLRLLERLARRRAVARCERHAGNGDQNQ